MTIGHGFSVRRCLVIALLFVFSSLAVIAQDQGGKKQAVNVKVLSKGVEVVEVTPSAEKCPKPNDATTVRLKVTSETPVDVRLYVGMSFGKWLPKDFLNKGSGAEISDYRCAPKAQYRVYTRAAGSAGEWPKP